MNMHGIGHVDGHTIFENESVLSAVDTIDGRDHLVIADVSREDAWIAVPEDQAHLVPTSR